MRVQARLFVRPPQAGQVKTRLEPALGPDGAAALYRRLLAYTCRELAAVPELGVVVDVAGAPEDPLLRAALPASAVAWPRVAQVSGDLGARMEAAAGAGLDAGDGVLLLGSDCPVLTAAHLRAAQAALTAAPVVLVPAEDGGYVLLGLARAARAALSALFRGVPWSTAVVADETRRRAATAGLAVHELAPLWDVDEPEDLDRLAALGWTLPPQEGPLRPAP